VLAARRLRIWFESVRGLSASAATTLSWRNELKMGFRKVQPP
jgi:hypothetical protein